MKKIFLLLVFLCAGRLAALERHYPLSEMVPESEIIVIADLGKVRTWNESGFDHGLGVLTVHKSICGGYKPGDTLTLKWHSDEAVDCPRNEHGDTKGQSFIWLLNRSDKGYVITGTNQRMRRLTDEAAIDSILRANPLMMKMPYLVPENEPGLLRIGFRNAGEEDLEIPAIRWRDGKLYLHENYGLTVYSHANKKLLQPEENGNLISADPEYIRIAPGEEYSVEIPLRKLFPILEKGGYLIRFFRKDMNYKRREIPSENFYYIDYK